MSEKLQLEIFNVTYPNVPGTKRRSTSRAAAVHVGKKFAPNLREMVLNALRRSPASTDEVAEQLHQSVLSIRPRFSELAKLGKIEDSGRRHTNESGRHAIIWQAVND